MRGRDLQRARVDSQAAAGGLEHGLLAAGGDRQTRTTAFISPTSKPEPESATASACGVAASNRQTVGGVIACLTGWLCDTCDIPGRVLGEAALVGRD